MSVRLQNLSKRFGANEVIRDLSTTFPRGKLSILLGASGCGKTTTLRCIAGLETPSGGEICINDRQVFGAATGTNLPPEQRDLSMVFQSYAIWPHMTVGENVALPLKARGIPRSKRRDLVHRALTLVGLAQLESRPATQLSGGQQQRVALARSIVHPCSVLLLDEPLSNLDARLRVQMRQELSRPLVAQTPSAVIAASAPAADVITNPTDAATPGPASSTGLPFTALAIGLCVALTLAGGAWVYRRRRGKDSPPVEPKAAPQATPPARRRRYHLASPQESSPVASSPGRNPLLDDATVEIEVSLIQQDAQTTAVMPQLEERRAGVFSDKTDDQAVA